MPDPNYNCRFCSRDVRTIGDSHFRDPDNGSVICQDCGVGDAPTARALETPDRQNETGESIILRPEKINLTDFMKTIPEIANERVRKIVKYGYNASDEAGKGPADFYIVLRGHLNSLEKKIRSKKLQDHAQARLDIVRIAHDALSYLEAHPLPHDE